MNYYIDTEFLEGTQKTFFGKSKPTIDLISIGIVSEDSREYYAISKDFNLKEAWNRYDLKKEYPDDTEKGSISRKVYWLRENVLKPIYKELHSKENLHARQAFHRANVYIAETKFDFSYKDLKRLIKKYSKTNKQIAEEIKEFVQTGKRLNNYYENETIKVDFYGYYADYDWVAFCWLFGKMMDLPNGFPMYCRDLKQTLDEKVNALNWLYARDTWNNSRMSIKTIGKGDSQEKDRLATFEEKLKRLKELDEYPKQTDEHNALADARWNKQLHKFLKVL